MWSCLYIVLFEALVGFGLVAVVCVVNCLLIASMIYMQTCLFDIKSMFVLHVDTLSKSKKNSELLLLEFCKEAIGLHERVIRYVKFRIYQSLSTMYIVHSTCFSTHFFFFFHSARFMHRLAAVTNPIIFIMIIPYTMCVCFCMFTVVKVMDNETKSMSTKIDQTLFMIIFFFFLS